MTGLAPEIYRRLLTYTAGWRGARVAPDALIVGLHEHGPRPPLYWCLQGFRELSQLALAFGEDQPIYGLRSAHRVADEDRVPVAAIAGRYVAEIERTRPDGPLLLGANCQGSVIIFEVARQLADRGRSVPLVALLDPRRPEPYGGPVSVFFTRESVTNPWRYYRSPELGWRRLCPRADAPRFLEGMYGTSFDAPFVHDFARTLKGAIDTALAAGEGRSAEAPDALPSTAYAARVRAPDSLALIAGELTTVRAAVENLGAVSWPPTEASGITLANRWLRTTNGHADVTTWVDGRASFSDPTAPGTDVELELVIRAPERPGAYLLELDVVEEGVTWFMHRGSSSTRIPVTVRASDSPVPIDAAMLLDRADALLFAGSFELALAAFDETRALGEAGARVHLGRGRALLGLGRYRDAAAALESALDRGAPSPEHVRRLLGEAYEGIPDAPLAIETYRSLLTRDPSNPHLVSALARCHSRQDAYDEVDALCREGLRLEPDNPDLYALLGHACRMRGDRSGAVEYTRTAFDLGLTETQPLLPYARDLQRLGDWTAAIDAFQRAVAAAPRDPEALRCLADVLREDWRLAEAVEVYHRAIEEDPEDAHAYAGLGECHRRAGAFELAVSYHRRALEREPDLPWARRGLRRARLRWRPLRSYWSAR